jgi:non-ribosomal peptide synthetase component E (peptide arylation enzyme)
LKTFVRSRIADYKTPEWIFVEPRLPTNSVGKIDRAALGRAAAVRISGSA